LGTAAGAIALIAFLVGSWFYGKLRGSLPVIDGTGKVPGLIASVKVERDAQGVPTLAGQSFGDIARALGYVHAQDRFFQMDLARRRGAGELAEIFGKGAVPLDRRARIHDFRPLAQKVLMALPREQRAALEAYSAGVNAGLASLKVKPFEYVVLRVKPAAWKPEDCLLVGYAMVLTLEDDQGQYLRSLHRMRMVLGEKAVDFFSPRVGPMDAALDGSAAPLPATPGPTMINLREKIVAKTEGWSGASADRAPLVPGSNSLAVAGAPGAAVLANDMHLDLGMPAPWYRAVMIWPQHRLMGMTLPGTPGLIAGSNGKIAWGLTAAGAGTGDLILVNTDLPDFYRGPDADEFPIRQRAAVIHVKGGKDVAVSTDWTVWGPVVAHGDNHQLVVYHWAMDDPTALDAGLMKLNDAGTVGEAIEVAHRTGLPTLNFLVADAQGQIGWTVIGKLPKRVGFTGRWAVLFQYRDRKWDGWLKPTEVPTVLGKDFLWTANQRMLGGAGLEKLGDGGYARGARAAQIRDSLIRLQSRETPGERRAGAATPSDLLKIELDDRALFLGWWRQLALSHLQPGPAKDAVKQDCSRASVESTGYRFVREFRLRVAAAVLDPIFAGCAEDDDNFNWSRFNYEPALRELLTKQPIHLLDPRYASWDDLIKAQAKAQSARLATWGEYNTLHMVHPFSRVMPSWLTSWLNLPAVQLPGDDDMPRVQAPHFGASERFAVSPGKEEQGIFEMPGGESGHPLSPFYAAGHRNWVEGKSSPFLPGAPAHTLMLRPE
jgi:penicillin amidase